MRSKKSLPIHKAAVVKMLTSPKANKHSGRKNWDLAEFCLRLLTWRCCGWGYITTQCLLFSNNSVTECAGARREKERITWRPNILCLYMIGALTWSVVGPPLLCFERIAAARRCYQGHLLLRLSKWSRFYITYTGDSLKIKKKRKPDW